MDGGPEDPPFYIDQYLPSDRRGTAFLYRSVTEADPRMLEDGGGCSIHCPSSPILSKKSTANNSYQVVCSAQLSVLNHNKAKFLIITFKLAMCEAILLNIDDVRLNTCF